MSNHIELNILGDFAPFSREGRCISFQVEIAGDRYIVDCGSPIFKQLGGHNLKEVKGLFITHCHDDHKRWFTDLAIFYRYARDMDRKLILYTTESINDDLQTSASAALHNTLSNCRKQVIGVKYEEYVDFFPLGPRPRYQIVSRHLGEGLSQLKVVDRNGDELPPNQAKVVVNPDTGRARMLFFDPGAKEWVDPDLYYALSDQNFYEGEPNILQGPGYTIEAIKAPVWHGMNGIGIKFTLGAESLVFSSDTVNDRRLWEELAREKRKQDFSVLTAAEFAAARVIYGDINHYIERVWSKARYREALAAFNDAAVVHDIAMYNSIVHTDYDKLDRTRLDPKHTLLVHCPDRITSSWPLSAPDKTYIIKDNCFFEKIDKQLLPSNADFYHREAGRYYVGYRNPAGRHTVFEKNGELRLKNDYGFNGRPLCRIDLYEDIDGHYYPFLEDADRAYQILPDNRRALISYTDEGCRGRLLGEGERLRLGRRRTIKQPAIGTTATGS